MGHGVEGETCAGFLRRMEPTARWAAARHARAHPYLGSDDLFQEAMEALVRAWQALYPMPEDDLARVGHQAILWRLRRARERARAFGEGDAVVLHLGASDDVGGGEKVKHDADAFDTATAVAGDADCFFPVFEVLLDRELSSDARAVLYELTNPGRKTLAAVRQARKRWAGKRGNWWRAERVGVLGKGVELSQKKVRNALSEIRRTVYRMVNGQTGDSGDNNERRPSMGGERGFVPDGVEAGLPEAEKPAVVQGAAKAAVATSNKKKGGSMKTKTKVKKAGKKVTKSKAEKKAKPAKQARNGRVADDLRVVLGKPAAPGSMRAKIQEYCGKTPVTVADLVAKAKVPDVPVKVRIMLARGLLKRA